MCTFKICAMVSFAQACPRGGQKSEFQLVLRVTFGRRYITEDVIIQLAMSFPNVLFCLLFLSEESKEDEIIPPGQLHCEMKHRGLTCGSLKLVTYGIVFSPCVLSLGRMIVASRKHV